MAPIRSDVAIAIYAPKIFDNRCKAPDIVLMLLLMLMAQESMASSAQSRVKMLKKMEANATPLPERKTSLAKMKLQPPPACYTKQASVYVLY